MTKVLTKFYDRVLIEHEIAKVLRKALKSGFTRTFSIKRVGANINELDQLLSEFDGKQYKKTPLLDNFQKICQTVGEMSPECDGATEADRSFKAGLLIIYDVLLSKEDSRKPS